MAFSKLIPLYSFPPGTLLPTQKSPSPQKVHLNPFKTPSTILLKTTQLPMIPLKLSPKTSIKEEERESPYHHQLYENSSDFLTVAFPSLKFSNILFFNSAYNIQVVVGEHEPEENLINRFRRDVLRAGVLQECKRRRFFECSQEKRKRKTREAAKRNRKRFVCYLSRFCFFLKLINCWRTMSWQSD
ncbi:30S ribosomal protein s21 chloroplastic [Phtheirospermum japonicum]|uniref:30S ribosomal protein s21 chloroplastic n=1 Tax=Phtheirospermum japonicum TaxID=374723 RepID=A0A830BD50_9LAMI|nr:30S ribosomal protein s21 chloroplastic [Phtheirospermum japonicum]